MEIHFLDTDEYQFSKEERNLVTSIGRDALLTIRRHLLQVPDRIHLLVEPGDKVIDVTGDVGFALAPHAIRWTVDPRRNVGEVARAHLGHTLAHEIHHAVRLLKFPEEAFTYEWRGGAIFEGLATVFEREIGGFEPPWGLYDLAVIEQWADELFAQPIDDTYRSWKFEHPDGRRWIAYRVGTWIVDRACQQSGRTAADLVGIPWKDILMMAALSGEGHG